MVGVEDRNEDVAKEEVLDLAMFRMQQLQFQLHLRRMVESSLC